MTFRSAFVSSCLMLALVGCGRPEPRSAQAQTEDIVLPLEAETIEGRVPRAATLETLLRQHDVDPGIATSVVNAVAQVFNPRSLKADRNFKLTRTLDGFLREFQYQIDPTRFLRVALKERGSADAAEFDVAVVPYKREISLDAVTANITRERPSLIAAFDAAGENVQLPLMLAEAFSGEIDFNSELQRGDSASVLFERVKTEGQPSIYGDVEAAVLDHGKRRLVGIRFAGGDGKPGWYDENGRSLKRAFLKSPLPFDPRVTSGFTNRRLHPVYGDVRAHLGVDYAAPIGTAVVAVANGVVESADWSGDAGRMVAVRHADGYETLYLHLSSFAPGLRPGLHVSQGQLLGRVGMTGAATGPHLDFRVKKNGTHMNPRLLYSRMPPGEPIAPDQLGAFNRTRDKVLAQLKDLSGTH
jgi:murein DD-endopeptidase MepM/ murein hydrolase activator NlpD